jgi:hypothetical protein
VPLRSTSGARFRRVATTLKPNAAQPDAERTSLIELAQLFLKLGTIALPSSPPALG